MVVNVLFVQVASLVLEGSSYVKYVRINVRHVMRRQVPANARTVWSQLWTGIVVWYVV